MATNNAQVDNLVSMLDAYAEKGGHHLNVNVLNRDMSIRQCNDKELVMVRGSVRASDFLVTDVGCPNMF